MKTEKMSFKNIKDVLSRDEMKSVMAGSGTDSCPQACSGDSSKNCYRNTSLACVCNVNSSQTPC